MFGYKQNGLFASGVICANPLLLLNFCLTLLSIIQFYVFINYLCMVFFHQPNKIAREDIVLLINLID